MAEEQKERGKFGLLGKKKEDEGKQCDQTPRRTKGAGFSGEKKTGPFDKFKEKIPEQQQKLNGDGKQDSSKQAIQKTKSPSPSSGNNTVVNPLQSAFRKEKRLTKMAEEPKDRGTLGLLGKKKEKKTVLLDEFKEKIPEQQQKLRGDGKQDSSKKAIQKAKSPSSSSGSNTFFNPLELAFRKKKCSKDKLSVPGCEKGKRMVHFDKMKEKEHQGKLPGNGKLYSGKQYLGKQPCTKRDGSSSSAGQQGKLSGDGKLYSSTQDKQDGKIHSSTSSSSSKHDGGGKKIKKKKGCRRFSKGGKKKKSGQVNKIKESIPEQQEELYGDENQYSGQHGGEEERKPDKIKEKLLRDRNKNDGK